MSDKLYYLNCSFWIKEIVKLLLFSYLAGMLFFDSLVGVFVVLPGMSLICVIDLKNERERQRRQLTQEFKNAVVCMAGNLGAGYSMDNAFILGIEESIAGLDGRGVLIRRLPAIKNALSCNVSLSVILSDFAYESKIADIMEIASLIGVSKNYGGNVSYLIRQYANNVSKQQTTIREIETLISAKKMEGMCMIVAPFAIVAYMRLTNKEYMQVLYDGTIGRIVMMFAYVMVLASILITQKIIRIEV